MLLKKHLPSGLVLYTERLACGVSSLVSLGVVVSEGLSRAFVDVDAGGVELPIDSKIFRSVEPPVVDTTALLSRGSCC